LNAQVIDITPLSDSVDNLGLVMLDDVADNVTDDEEEELNDASLGQVEDDDDIPL